MVEKKSPPSGKSKSEQDRLLELYLSLSPARRAERFADTLQAAELAGVTRRTIQQWIAAGCVQACFVGRQYRVDLESLRRYLKTCDAAWLNK